MKLFKDIDQRLETSLQGLPIDSPEIRIFPSDTAKLRYFARVVSKTFEGMNEARRQALVWNRLLNTLDDSDQRRVEFVFTDAPSERPATPSTSPKLAHAETASAQTDH